jgi:hypothetical protein
MNERIESGSGATTDSTKASGETCPKCGGLLCRIGGGHRSIHNGVECCKTWWCATLRVYVDRPKGLRSGPPDSATGQAGGVRIVEWTNQPC